jgi:hypothetical protein
MDKISGRPEVRVDNELVLDAGSCKESRARRAPCGRGVRLVDAKVGGLMQKWLERRSLKQSQAVVAIGAPS